MKNQNDHTPEPLVKKSRFGLRHIIGLVALVILVTALVTVWWVNRYIYASEFTPRPYYLAQSNECSMQNWRHWDAAAHDDLVVPTKKRKNEGRPLVPEAYSEKGDKRELNLTEKEVNALIANNNPKVAQRVAIDLSGNLVSVKLVVPMGDEIPLLGEKNTTPCRVQLGYEDGRPVVALKGVSLGGIPLPNAWLDNLKNKNLAQEFGAGFLLLPKANRGWISP